MRLLLAATLLLSANPALAQMRTDTPDHGTLRVTLPAGEVLISMNTVEDRGLVIHAGGDQEVLVDSAHMPQWLETYGNSALLRLNMGTAQCDVSHRWITFDESGLRASEEFGTCAYDGDYSVTDAGPAYFMKGATEGEKDTTFLFDPASGKISASN